ncbi:MAG TPA: acetate/propionate family kinase [Acidimicrobiales bacterium]
MAALSRVLVVNAGSSSLKLAMVGEGDQVLGRAEVERWGRGDVGAVADAVRRWGRPDATGHRVVHGGPSFTGPVVVEGDVLARIEALADLAPLHQPAAVAGLRAVADLLPGVPAVACFDTAFHAGLPAPAATYALPSAWRERWGLRRYGFHGLSHAWAAGRAAAMLGRPLEDLALVTCHLGAGASLCAVLGGRSVDTTMGFTPLEGLVMATRSGTVDPGLVLWLLDGRLSLDEVADGLEHRSGLAGLAGSGDVRDVLAGGHRDALDVYVHRLAREAAGMVAALGRLDALVFTGGVGEHSPEVRAGAAARLAFLGVAVDEAANAACRPDADVTAPGAEVGVLVVESREDLEIARQVRSALGA